MPMVSLLFPSVSPFGTDWVRFGRPEPAGRDAVGDRHLENASLGREFAARDSGERPYGLAVRPTSVFGFDADPLAFLFRRARACRFYADKRRECARRTRGRENGWL